MLASKLGDFYPVEGNFYTDLNQILPYRTGQITDADSELDFMSALKKMFGVTEEFVMGMIHHQLTVSIDDYFDHEEEFQNKLHELYGSDGPDPEQYDSDEEGYQKFEAAVDEWSDNPLKLVRILCMHIVDSLGYSANARNAPFDFLACFVDTCGIKFQK